MNLNADNATRFTAWCAIIGAAFCYLSIILVLAATGGDSAMVLHGPSMLMLEPGAREMFRWGMFADILGFYLPVLVIGVYSWRRFRDSAGALGDMALLAITIYVVVGVSGAAMQLAALHPLALLHAGGDDTVKAAAEAAYTGIAHASQRGLWWSEGPLVLFWGLVIADQLKRAGWGTAIPLLLKFIGVCFTLFFVFGMFPGLGPLMQVVLIVVVLAFPFWMLLFGWKLLRLSAQRSA